MTHTPTKPPYFSYRFGSDFLLMCTFGRLIWHPLSVIGRTQVYVGISVGVEVGEGRLVGGWVVGVCYMATLCVVMANTCKVLNACILLVLFVPCAVGLWLSSRVASGSSTSHSPLGS